MSYSNKNINSRPRRRIFTYLTILSIIASVGFCRPHNKSNYEDYDFTSPGLSTSFTLTTTNQRKTLNEDIGLPLELFRKNNNKESIFDSSNVSRRITPKSIFIAPSIKCQDGYTWNDNKGCVPVTIDINEDLQSEFVLLVLNRNHGKIGNNKKKPEDTGPLQINIPFATSEKLPQKSNDNWLTTTTTTTTTSSTTTMNNHDERIKDSFVVPTYNVSQSINNSSSPNNDSISNVNQTTISVIDYKIPSSNKKSEENSSTSLTMVLLQSSTTTPLPIYSESFIVTTKSNDQRYENNSSNSSSYVTPEYEENTTTPQLSSSSSTMDIETSLDVGTASTEKIYTDENDEDVAYTYDEAQTEILTPATAYEHVIYDDVIGDDDEDELLKHGEAGMMIPIKNRDVMKNNQQTLTTTLPIEIVNTTIEDEITEIEGSTVKIEETVTTELPLTVYNTEIINQETINVTPKITTTNKLMGKMENLTTTETTTITEINDSDSTLITEFTTETIYGRKRPAISTTTTTTTQRPYKITKSSTTTVSSQQEERKEEKETMVNAEIDSSRSKPSIVFNDNDQIYFKNDENIPLEFKDQMFDLKRLPTINDDNVDVRTRQESFVKFPDQSTIIQRRPDYNNHQRQGTSSSIQQQRQNDYVRFPSDEVNSIHSSRDVYKDDTLLSSYRSKDFDNPYPITTSSSSSTKNNLPNRQRQQFLTNWQLSPPNARLDRQQQKSRSITTNHRQGPQLKNFWLSQSLRLDPNFNSRTSLTSDDRIVKLKNQLSLVKTQQRSRTDDDFNQPISKVRRNGNGN